MPDLIYMDDDLTIAQAVSAPVLSAPLSDKGVNVLYLLTQKFWQLRADRALLALDTPHPDYPDFGLVSEGQESDIGGNVVEWTRTYAKAPATFSRIEGITNYTFPALVTGDVATSRPPTTISVPIRIVREFMRTINPDADLPPLLQQRYVLQAHPQVDASVDGVQQPAVADLTTFSAGTIPSLATYQLWVADPTNHEIIPFASATELWMGNIWMRKTAYIEPK